jgi:hypothetical protein
MKILTLQFGAGFLISLAALQAIAGDIIVNNASVQGKLLLTNTSGNQVTITANANNSIASSGGIQISNGSSTVSLSASTTGLSLSSGLAVSPYKQSTLGPLILDQLNPKYSAPLEFYQSNSFSWRIQSGNGSEFGSSNRLYFSRFHPTTGRRLDLFIINPAGDISLYTTNQYSTIGCGFGCTTNGYFGIGPGVKFVKDTDNSLQTHAARGVSVGSGAYSILSSNDSGIIRIKTIAAGQNLSISDANDTLTFNVMTNSNPQSAVFITNTILGVSTNVSFTHSFSGTPQTFSLYAVCLTANNGYAVNDVVKADSLMSYNGSSWMRPYFNVTANATSLVVATDSESTLLMMPKTGGSYVNIYTNRACWSLKLIATYTPNL